MNLRPLSDLHFEADAYARDPDAPERFATEQDTGDVDVCILAGDICNATSEEAVFRALLPFSQVFPHVVYVAGNHEFWHSTPQDVMPRIKAAAKLLGNVTALDNEVAEIQGKRFVGGTMWYDLSPEIPNGAFWQRKGFADFHVIKGKTDASTVEYIQRSGTDFIKLLKRELRKDDIVVTHHCPSQRSVAPRYAGRANNCFYVYDMPNWVWEREPAYWQHGHLHTARHYRLNETTVVCNPKGHPHDEPTGFDKNLIVCVP